MALRLDRAIFWALPAPPDLRLSRALWSLLGGSWGLLKGSWGMLDGIGIYLEVQGAYTWVLYKLVITRLALLRGLVSGL